MDGPDALPATSAASRWRTRIAQARPEWSRAIRESASALIDHAAIVAMLDPLRGEGWTDEAHLNRGLRALRARVFAALIDRDLDGRADLSEVMQATTALAEIAIGEAMLFHAARLAKTYGVPVGRDSGAAQDLVVIGMGKLGGCELNVSSDVDLIFVYGEDGETQAGEGAVGVRAIANEDFFTRLGKKLIASLAEVTADGHVFRVDMRLRPDGDSGPLVTSLASLERYLVASARDWERFAWIKARVVSPPVFAQDPARELEQLITPFVYRRYLDFGAIDALRRLHGQIRDEATRREAVRHVRAQGTAQPRIDVKLGRGGIREIEFIAQHFQLIRGGRDTALRLRPTRATIARLVEQGLIDPDSGTQLQEAYAFLRNVEHRLQYLDDAQTHTLPRPDATDDCERLVAMCERLVDAEAGPGFDGLVRALERRRRLVEAHFDAIFAASGKGAGQPSSVPELWEAFSDATPVHARDESAAAGVRSRLEALGFTPPEGAFARLAALGRSARLKTLTTATRARLDALIPRLVAAASAQADPTATLARWFDLVEAIAGRSAYLALLDEYPAVLATVTRMLAASPWAAQYLALHPLLLDELIDAPESEHAIRDAATWSSYWRGVAKALTRELTAAAPDAERQMDLLRETHHVETFRLLIDDLDGRLTIEVLSDQLSALADVVVDAAVRHCWAHYVSGRGGTSLPAEPAFAVIAYGKLGGKELGYASDLDLVFLFDPRGEPDIAEHYARFAQRLTNWLTAQTSAGALFDIDLRLRPDGAAGLAVSSIDAWSRYERRADDVGAWTWEHQALTRARFSAGDPVLGATFERERADILVSGAPDEAGRAGLRQEILAMRRKMHDGHPNRSGLFDLKHDDGGMVDIEFAVQYLVLAHGASHRGLIANVGNIALLSRAAEAGLIDRDDATQTADAYRVYRARQHAIRLADPLSHAARVDANAFAEERSAVRRLWRNLFG